MKTAYTWLLCGSLLLIACADKKIKKTTQKPVKATKVEKSVKTVRMDRGACFGRCPIYTLELSSNGLARYTGKKFTRHIGVYEKMVNKEKVNSILQQFAANRVDTMKVAYNVNATDLPSLTYSIIYSDNTSAEVQNAHMGPTILNDLAKQMDELAKVDFSWKRISVNPE